MNQTSLISRLWQKDPSLWPGNPREIIHRLGWLSSPADFLSKSREIQSFAASMPHSHIVLLGMGGSSLVSKVFSHSLQKIPKPFFVLDTTDPAKILEIESAVDLSNTLFIVASKSGSTLEVDCLLHYFFEKSRKPENFIAITDFNTPLMRFAEEKKFLHVFINPSDIGGRFSALSYFGLVPLAFMGGNVERFLESALRAGEACKDEMNNPAFDLAHFLHKNLGDGKNKILFLAPPSLSSFPLWLEQLIAESTGKSGHGILPLIAEKIDRHQSDLVLCRFGTNTEDPIRDTGGMPTVTRSIQVFQDLGGEFFIWEFATAILGSLMGVNPFDEPDVVLAKTKTEQYLQNPDEIRTKIGSVCKPLVEIETTLRQARPPQFLGLLSFASKKATMVLEQRMREFPVSLSSVQGPSYLHSIGQFYKGGTNQGIFVVAVDDQSDFRIPGRTYGFQTVKLAQALADYDALIAAGRRAFIVKI